MNLTWYETFFEGVALDLWRGAVSAEQTRAEVDFLVGELRLEPGARVLDVPCGQGRHALVLAARGYRVTGVDLSAQAIDEARAASVGAGAEFVRADMRQLPWSAEFDAAFCLGNSFAYTEPPATRDFVHALARTLKPGARFALHTGGVAESILPRLRDRDEAQVDDITFIEENRYHAWESCIETTYTFVRDGQRDTRTGVQWVYTMRELRELLSLAGLEPERAYSSFDHAPYTLADPQLILIARKT